ncbi:CUB domain-containing protein 2-like [Haliotis rufescens]|uniref:CUB domain-containing protein 2-like n=1 Tax=Haliotis rufescens TaxID=6454 RepID=UPI00201F8E5E|nr:CUB domain-containing protein 2-like [Haliotis rufescens]
MLSLDPIIGLLILFCSSNISDAVSSCGNSNLTATSNHSYLESPGHPAMLSSDESCTWLISKSSNSDMIHVRIEVIDMNMTVSLTACTEDYIEVFDGPTTSSHSLGKWCGKQRPKVQSTWNSLTVYYKSSNTSTSNRGFKLEYFETKELLSCGGFYNFTGSFLQAPGYPTSYRTDTNCIWLIEVPNDYNIRIIVEDYDILASKDCSVDDLRFVDGMSPHSPEIGVLCGTLPPRSGVLQYTSSGQVLRVEFSADPYRAVVRPRGFKLAYLKGKFDPCTDTHLLASKAQQFITSPNYPDNYTSNSNCLWRIQSTRPGYLVQLTPLHFSLQQSPNCSSDYVSVYDGSSAGPGEAPIGRWCGSHMTAIHSNQSTMLFIFHTDGSHSQSGFNISYTEIPSPRHISGGTGMGVSVIFYWLSVVTLATVLYL